MKAEHHHKIRHLLIAAMIALTGLTAPRTFASSEPRIGSVPLFDPKPFKSTTSPAQAMLENLLTPLVGPMKFNGPKAKQYIMQVFEEEPVLKRYFPTAAERDALGNGARELFEREIGRLDSHEAANKTVQRLTRYMSDAIMNRVFQKMHLTDSARRDEWKNRFAYEVSSCTEMTQTATESLQCVDSFKAAMKPNIGLALVYELSHDNLMSTAPDASGLMKRLDSQYRKCITPKGDLENCVKDTIRAGILDLAMGKVKDTISPLFGKKERLNAAVAAIQPPFDACLKRTLNREDIDKTQLQGCIDTLAIDAGSATVSEKLMYDPLLRKHYDEKTRKKYSIAQQQDFRKCGVQQQAQGNRANGVVVLTSCQELVTNNMTYKTAEKVMFEAALKIMKNGDLAKTATQVGMTSVNHCWDKYQTSAPREACLRRGVKAVASEIASVLFDKGVGTEYLAARPGQKTVLLDHFDDCVARVMPANISQAKNLSNDLNQCAGPTRRESALDVADFKIRKGGGAYLSSSEMNKLLDQRLSGEFAQCLGPSPDDEKLKSCALRLTQGSAGDIAAIALPAQIRKQMPPASNPEQAKDFEEKIAKVSSTLTGAFRKCMMTKLADAFKADPVIDACARESGKSIADFIANIQFDSKVLPIYADDKPEGERLRGAILGELDRCINAIGPMVLSQFIDEMKKCGTVMTDRTILLLARDQVEKILKEQNLSQRAQQIRDEAGNLATCPTGLEDISNLEKQIKALMSSVGEIIKSYVDYDVLTAKKDLNSLLLEINKELQTVGPPDARKRMLDWMIKNTHIMDQFLKAYVKQQTVIALQNMPEHDRPSPALITKITDRKSLDAIFGTPRGFEILNSIVSEILEPIVVDSKGFNEPQIKTSLKNIEVRIRDMLTDSPQFGTALINESVSNQLKDLPWYKKLGARIFYGSKSLNWDELKKTQKGQQAEQYIRDNIVRPQIQQQPLTPEQDKERRATAEKMIRESMSSLRRWD